MTLTEPNVKWHTPADNVPFMVDVIEALCGGVGSIPSTTLWTVIDSWDGTTREVPSGNLLANSTNGWMPGSPTPGSGSWIVTQCQAGERSTVHQIKWTVSGTTAQMQLIPYADWTPGGGTGAAPTLPSRITVATSLNIGIGNTPRAIVWDESMVAWSGCSVATSTVISLYLGEVHCPFDESTIPRPFVHVRVTAATTWDSGSWSHYSQINDTTLCTANGLGMTLSGQLSTEIPFGGFLTPVRLYNTTVGHKYFIGTARHIANIPHPHTNSKTTWGLSLGVRDWMSQGTTTGHHAMRHDGTVLSFDELRLPTSEDLDVPTGAELVRYRPYLVRER